MRLFAGMVSICVVAMVASLAQAQSIRKGQAPRELHAHQAGYSVHAEPAMYGGDGCCGPTHQGCCCPILSTVVGGVKCVLNTIFPCHTGCGYASCGKCCLPSVRFHPPMSPCCNSYQGGVVGEEIMGPEMVVPSAPTTPSTTAPTTGGEAARYYRRGTTPSYRPVSSRLLRAPRSTSTTPTRAARPVSYEAPVSNTTATKTSGQTVKQAKSTSTVPANPLRR